MSGRARRGLRAGLCQTGVQRPWQTRVEPGGGGGAGTGCVLASALQRASRKIRDQAALGQCWAREPVKCTKGLEAVTSLTQPQLPRALPSITTPLDSPLPSSVLPKPSPDPNTLETQPGSCYFLKINSNEFLWEFPAGDDLPMGVGAQGGVLVSTSSELPPRAQGTHLNSSS